MAEFSSSDINEAKRRVWQMREKAKQFSNESIDFDEPEQKSSPNENHQQNNSSSNVFDIFHSLTSGEDGSKAIILALILILSHEKADNMLILALLYILL
jgi:hypothetical protein